MQDIFGRSEFIGQALLALTELTHDGEPMGFDLTLQIARSRHIKVRGGISESDNLNCLDPQMSCEPRASRVCTTPHPTRNPNRRTCTPPYMARRYAFEVGVEGRDERWTLNYP